MKPQRLMASLVLALALTSASAYADHYNPGYPSYPNNPPSQSISRLQAEAQDLNYKVQWAYLPAGGRESVARFAQEVNELAGCVNNAYPGYGNTNCQYQLNETVQSFYQVDRYLRDTAYSNPEIYNSFIRTQELLQRVQYEVGNGNGHPNPYPPNPYPPYPPAPIQLRAAGHMDARHYTFFGDRQTIQRDCMYFGRSQGLSAVRILVVNGQQLGGGYGGYLAISQACSLVAQYAR